MTSHTTRPQWVARASTLALWAVGSAYLVKSELVAPQPDWVLMCSTPVVWAIIISLPIMATYARRDRQWIAALLIWCAAIAGSVYTLQATLGRQAESRDMRVERAQQVESERARILNDLSAAKAMLAQAIRKCGTGRNCRSSTKATISVYEGAVAGHQHRLAKLHVVAPAAGERRIAALVAALTGHDTAKVSEAVGLMLPALFGIVVELSAFALAMFGWHPKKSSRKPFPETFSAPVGRGPQPGKHQPLPKNVVRFVGNRHPVLDALERVDRPINNNELAALMGVSPGEASKRWKEVSDRLSVNRVGRELRIVVA